MTAVIKSAKPRKMWIDGNCFAIAPKFANKGEFPSVENSQDKYNIKQLDDSKYSSTFALPSMYYSKFCNQEHFIKEEFERASNTELEFPKTFIGGSMTVKGNSINDVINARNDLHSIASSIRDKNRALQFISIPTLSPEISENFKQFKEDVLSIEGIEGMHESIFQKPEKLHLTVAVFSLQDDKEKAEAVRILNERKHDVLESVSVLKDMGALKIKLEGIECMNDNLRKVKVLYGKPKIVNETDDVNLQNIANKIQNLFYDSGLVVQYAENVKLHVTLINTKYRNESKSSYKNKKRFQKWQPFDATKIMEKYRDFNFGQADFNSVHLSLMSSVGEDGFYESIGSINI